MGTTEFDKKRKPRSAYLIFCNKIKKENPNIKPKDIGKLLDKEWQKADKRYYEELAKKEQELYNTNQIISIANNLIKINGTLVCIYEEVRKLYETDSNLALIYFIIYAAENPNNKICGVVMTRCFDIFFNNEEFEPSDECIEAIKILANKNNLFAYNCFGLMYKDGRGVKQSYDDAIVIFEKVGNYNIMKELGLMYLKAKDYAKANYCFEKCIDLRGY